MLFEYDGTKITYKQFLLDVICFASKFDTHFKNNNNLIFANTSYKWAVAYFAIVISGGVAVLAEANLKADELNTLCSKYKIKNVVSEHNFLNEGNDLLFININDIKVNISQISDYKFANMSEENVCTIAFTSGTTDIAKGIMLSHKNLCCDAYAGCSIYKYEQTDVVLNILPFYHLFGLTCVLLASLICGNRVILSNVRTFFDDLKTVNPTSLLLVPEIVEFLLLRIQKSGLQETVGTRLRKILCGGSHINKETVNIYRKLGIYISSCYGMTECSPGIAINPVEGGRSGTDGLVISCNQVKISPDDHEILVKGSNVMVGYYNNKELTEKVIVDGWFHTGDIGFLKDGFLSVIGKIKNLMVFDNGKKVNPEELEYKFMDCAEIDEILVYKSSNCIHAKIFSKSFLENSEAYKTISLKISKVNSELPYYKRIRKIEMVQEPFEKTSLNKIKRRNLNE